jgi:two-component sensor histidine kinase
LAAAAIGALAFIGWLTDQLLLSSWGADLPAISPLVALCLAALGLALMLPRVDRWVAIATGLVVAAIAVVDLSLALSGAGPGVEPRAPRFAQGLGLFVVPVATALGLILAGGALVLGRFERYHLAAIVLASLAGAIAVFGLLGYLTGISTLYNVTSIRSAPLPTLVALLCVAFGIVLRIVANPALRRPRPLWHLLVVLGCAIVAPLLLFGAYAGARMADAQLDQVRGQLMDEARTMLADVDREIIGEFETLQALAASPSLRHGDFAAFQRQAAAPLTFRRSGNIALFDRSLRQIVNTSVPFGTPMPRAVIVEPVERVFATGKPQLTGLFDAPVAKDVLFSILMPVKIDGEIRYALARSPSQRALARVVAANQLPPERTAAIWDAAQRIIALSEPQVPGIAVGMEMPPSQWGRAPEGGILEFTDSEGRPSLEAYTISDLTSWGAAVWAPKAVLGAPLTALWRTLGLMALLAFTLVVALALWVGRIIASSVGHAARAAVALGEGRPLAPSGTPVAEVNTLMAELRETAAKRQAAEDFLRDSAEKEHLLMREMNHRAKNMLSVVDAIAHQMATRNQKDFITRFSERIQSLSANQDLLLRNEWKGVEIKGLVDAQLAHFADLVGTRIAADGPTLRLTASSAQAIGLALHELATNAGKYGALSTETGRVDICWEADGGVFTMSWAESGGPPVSAPKRRGFGATVVKAMAERTVSGNVDLDYAPSGVSWRLTCPAANALEPPERDPAAATRISA